MALLEPPDSASSTRLWSHRKITFVVCCKRAAPAINSLLCWPLILTALFKWTLTSLEAGPGHNSSQTHSTLLLKNTKQKLLLFSHTVSTMFTTISTLISAEFCSRMSLLRLALSFVLCRWWAAYLLPWSSAYVCSLYSLSWWASCGCSISS